MSKSLKIRLSVFLILSVGVLGVLVSQLKNNETAVVVTLCGGQAQSFDYFSSDFRYSQRAHYPGGSSFSSIRFKPDEGKAQMGHRFDFGGIPGEKFLVSSIVLKAPGFYKYVLDLKKADQWIKRSNQLKNPILLDRSLLIETAGSDGYLVTKDNLFEHYAKKKLDLSGKKIAYAAGIEVFLLVFLLLFPWLVKGTISLGKSFLTWTFLLQFGVFAAVNLVVIFPAVYFSCRNVPDVLSVTLKAKNTFLLEIFYKTPYSSKFKRQSSYTELGNFQVLEVPLPKDAEKTRIRLDFGSIPQNVSVKSISVIHYGLFRRSVDLKHASEVYTSRNQIDRFDYRNGLLNLSACGTDPYIVPDPVRYSAFESSGIWFGGLFWTIAGAEIFLLLLLSQTVRRLVLKISPVRLANKENLWLSLSVAGAFAFIMTLSLPLQTFKMAEEIILFKMNLLVHFLCFLVPAVFIVLTALLFGLNKRYGAVFTIFLASVTVLFAIECGLLSFNLPELNGEFYAYRNIPRMILHIAVWTIGLILPLCFQKKITRWIPLVLLGVSIMNGASTIDALMKKNPFEGRGKLIVKPTIFDGTIEKVKYAVKNNVIMICLDAVTSEAFCEVLKEYPEWKSQYQGFTLFTNNIGMNVATMWAVPGFFTGKIITPEVPTVEYTCSMYSPDSALKNYIDRKYAVFFRVGLPNLSYIYPDPEAGKKATLLTPVEGSMLQWMFHELYLFKITPFFLKERLMRYFFYTVWPNRQKVYLADNTTLHSEIRDENYIYKKLAEAPLLDAKYPGAFHYSHFHGGHPPFNYDKNGNPVDHSHIAWKDDWSGYYERIVFEVKRVNKYLQALKKRDLYDDSVIIICADHGMEPTLNKKDIHPRYRPLLMVKCRNSKSPLNFVDIPTSHTKIAAFLKSADIFSIKQQDVPAMFYTKIRQVAVHRQFLITVDQNRKILSTKRLEGKKTLDKSITIGYKYYLYNISNDEFPPILYGNLVEQVNSLLLDHSSSSFIKFKVPDKSASYKIIFDAVIGTRGRDVSVDIVTNSGAKTVYRPGNSNIELRFAKPDQDGVIQIKFKIKGGSANLHLTSLTVEKE